MLTLGLVPRTLHNVFLKVAPFGIGSQLGPCRLRHSVISNDDGVKGWVAFHNVIGYVGSEDVGRGQAVEERSWNDASPICRVLFV